MSTEVLITGIGSISTCGPLRGPIAPREVGPQAIRAWPTRGLRRAFLVEPFRPADVAPGVKTRRLDRLSAWSLVAAVLALQDARIELSSEDRSRWAIVLGTGFGCLDTTESFFRTAAACGFGKADPILFPDSLSNSAASHVARQFGVTGPNITVTCRGVSGEAALIEAASLLRSGEAERALVIAGDTLTRPLYEWYEAAGVLSGTCFGEEVGRPGLIPGEGLAAVVMECGGRGATARGRYLAGALAADPGATAATWGRSAEATVRAIRAALSGLEPSNIELVVSAANGSRALEASEAEALREVFGGSPPRVFAPKTMLGEFDGNATLRLAMALPAAAGGGPVLLLGASAGGGRAAVLFQAS